ncbi:MAG TPA: secretin N-terminal domain-containing protein [Thermoanaerobaculia bacterium]|nr:secretin N-terminal domain-containing protein [Thermoanaerobaculia bacterium]
MKRALMTFAALLLLSGIAFADDADTAKSLSVRTFTFKYKDPGKAAEIIKPLLSQEGSISIQAGSNALIVTDRAENLKSVAKTLTDYDAPPQAFRLIVRLVGASRREGTPKVSDDLRDIAPKLGMLGFNFLENLGTADFAGREGDPGILTLASGYRAEFKLGEFDPTSDSVKVSDFRISKVQNDQVTSLPKTTLNLRLGQTYIFGATKTPQSQRALMIVLIARR